jgi:hypothetical protein
MRNRLIHNAKLLVIALLLVIPFCSAIATASQEDFSKYFPDRLGSFRRVGVFKFDGEPNISEFRAQTDYVGKSGARFTVVIERVLQDARAYELFSITAHGLREKESVQINSSVGTSAFIASSLGFVKGPAFVRISPANSLASVKDSVALGQELAASLDRGEGDIPVLIKHLPNWEQAQQTATYLSRFNSLDPIARDSALSVVSSEGDADAVIAKYDAMRLLIIEFNTPQRAVENDQRIIGRIQELWKLGEPAPSAYRRIGNYSVFVFDAPNEQAAKQLIDQVHYEQVVSWLGENPNILKEAEKHYVRTTLGVLIAVMKASGFALVGCLASGGLIGALLFTRRRAQQRSVQTFSDAGGMLRLNLDEMTPQPNQARLIGRQ